MKKIVIRLIKLILPEDARKTLRLLEKRVRYFLRQCAIKIPVFEGRPIKIIVGAALTHQNGWYSTNEQWLDIKRSEDWQRVFKGKTILTHVLAEHVFEHLTEEEARQALRFISGHMMSKGKIRIAVPDGYNPNPAYIEHVGIGGKGADAAGHKQLLNTDTLSHLLEGAGFETKLLEGYLRNGQLIMCPCDPSDGKVQRSRSNPENMAAKAGWDFPDANTSLIVDGVLRSTEG